MKEVVRSGPEEIAFRKEMKETGQRLIEIDEAEGEIEGAHRPLAAGKNDTQPDCSEEDMEKVVGDGPAREAQSWRQQKPEDADDDEEGSEDAEDLIIKVARYSS
jgi:hypothetical protein